MDFKTWLAAEGYDAEKITSGDPAMAKQRKHLEAAWKEETKPAEKPAVKPPANPATSPESTYDEEVEAARREADRRERIQEITKSAVAAHVGNRDKINRFDTICKEAIADKWNIQKFELNMLREERNVGLLITSPRAPQATNDILEAAVAVAHKLPNVEKSFSAETLDAAHKQFRRGLTLKRLLMLGARQNGFRGDDSDYSAVCKAAMGMGQYHDMRADITPSTGVQVPGILGNTANKFLASSFMMVDQSWRAVSKIRPVNDFKATSTYRMGGNNTFLRVPPAARSSTVL